MKQSSCEAIVIAEIGVNHDGSFNKAKELVDAAAEAGANYAKFQYFDSVVLNTISAVQAEYQIKNTGIIQSQRQMLSELELTLDEMLDLEEYCQSKNIGFALSVFDAQSVDSLQAFDLDFIKIPSGNITDKKLLEAIAVVGKQILLSTGMSDMADVVAAYQVLKAAGAVVDDIVLLQCTSSYPAAVEDTHLRAMVTLGSDLGVDFGLSDHSESIFIPAAAVAMGARVIEKHITLDRTSVGPDHLASLEPTEFRKMVEGIRAVELALGSAVKRTLPSELSVKSVARKSLVASQDIKRGEKFLLDNLTSKRPGMGVSPMHIDLLLGKCSLRDYFAGDLISLDELM